MDEATRDGKLREILADAWNEHFPAGGTSFIKSGNHDWDSGMTIPIAVALTAMKRIQSGVPVSEPTEEKTCDHPEPNRVITGDGIFCNICGYSQLFGQALRLSETTPLSVPGGGDDVWTFCPECGCDKYREAFDGERECSNCKQSWFSDINYIGAVIENLSDRYKLKATSPPIPSVLTDSVRESEDDADTLVYHLAIPDGGFRLKDTFTAREKAKLRPIAETLAMLDGNAFFGMTKDEAGDDEWFVSYLPEAFALYEANGGDRGWAGEASFAHPNPLVENKGGKRWTDAELRTPRPLFYSTDPTRPKELIVGFTDTLARADFISSVIKRPQKKATPAQPDQIYKVAWDAYVDATMDASRTTFDAIKSVVDASLREVSGPQDAPDQSDGGK